MRILVTGGAGYIGSHTILTLLEQGHTVHSIDNLCNSSEESLRRVSGLSGAGDRLTVQKGDVREASDLYEAFEQAEPDAVIHFAGLKAVGESTQQPLRYYDNNVGGTISLLRAMERHGCHRLVFSSSATVYSQQAPTPFVEDAELGASNPYGATKLTVETMLRQLDPAVWSVAILRYFNPIGAHPSGEIGDDPQGIPNNLLPFVAQVATGRRAEVSVFGDDYDTVDGTGVRDYVHVMDLAEGHVKALDALQSPGIGVWNLGTGRPVSVLEMIAAFEAATGQEIPYRITERRPGDVAVLLADPSRAAAELDWRAIRDLATMCRDHWAWQAANPMGYAG